MISTFFLSFLHFKHDITSFFFKVLKCLNQFIQNFSSLIKSQFEGMFVPIVCCLAFVISSIFYLFDKTLFAVVILGPLWNTFVSSLRVYEQASIEGAEDSYEGRYDSDGSEISLDSFVIQVTKAAVFDVYYFDDLIMQVFLCQSQLTYFICNNWFLRSIMVQCIFVSILLYQVNGPSMLIIFSRLMLLISLWFII